MNTSCAARDAHSQKSDFSSPVVIVLSVSAAEVSKFYVSVDRRRASEHSRCSANFSADSLRAHWLCRLEKIVQSVSCRLRFLGVTVAANLARSVV